MGWGTLIFINFNRGRIGQFGIGTIWIYLPDRAANAAIRWFMGKEGKATTGWLLRSRYCMYESRFVVACTAMLS